MRYYYGQVTSDKEELDMKKNEEIKKLREGLIKKVIIDLLSTKNKEDIEGRKISKDLRDHYPKIIEILETERENLEEERVDEINKLKEQITLLKFLAIRKGLETSSPSYCEPLQTPAPERSSSRQLILERIAHRNQQSLLKQNEIKDLQVGSDEEITVIPLEIPGLQMGLVDSKYYDVTYYDFSPTITPRIIPDLQMDYENYQSSSTPSKEKQQNRDAVSLINNNIRAEVVNYLFIEVFRAIEEIYEGNHAVAMINEFNANVEKIFLIAEHLTKEFAEPKTSEKHLHLKKLKKITETLKIFIDESPLSHLISEKDLILKKNVSKENSADKKKIDLKIKYSLSAINNQSKKFEKRLLETAKFLDNQNIQSTKPSADTISAFAENVLEKSTNAKKQKYGRD